MIIIYTLKYNNQSIIRQKTKKPCQIKVMNNLLILENETIGQMWIEGERRGEPARWNHNPLAWRLPIHPPVLCITYIVRVLRRITTFICKFSLKYIFHHNFIKKIWPLIFFEIRYFEIKKLLELKSQFQLIC
jgi:hypothetical protein